MDSGSKEQVIMEARLKKLMGRAIHGYDLIADGDRILVGVSGGKDSLSLLHLLLARLPRIPIAYEILAVHLDLGFETPTASIMEDHFKTLGCGQVIEKTDIGPRALSPENRESPCFLCAWLRRKRLFELARIHHCNKIALGHHQDDLMETLFLNIFYSGEISAMLPRQEFFGGEIVVIRPLALVEEERIRRFARTMNLPVIPGACPFSSQSKRLEIKKILNELFKKNRKVRGNVFHALSHVKTDYLLPPLRRSPRQGRKNTETL
jgi:tRNA 2-thiocytidine biosynthesis protein TtcA